MTENYSYTPPEINKEWKSTKTEEDYWSTFEHATGMSRQEINAEWQRQKEANRQWNLANAHGCFVKGTYKYNP